MKKVFIYLEIWKYVKVANIVYVLEVSWVL